MDDKLMKLITAYFGREVIARNYPSLLFNKIFDKTGSRLRHEKKITKAEGNDSWHVDHATLLNLHILLEDVNSEDETCMEYLPVSNK